PSPALNRIASYALRSAPAVTTPTIWRQHAVNRLQCRSGVNTSPDEAAVPGSRQDGRRRTLMAWTILILSGAFEAVWATALGRSDGLSKLWPTVIFFAALVVSMGGLAWAMKTLPTGTSYAIWVGVGASLTVIYSMATGAEPVTLVRLLLICGLIGCIIGLKAVS